MIGLGTIINAANIAIKKAGQEADVSICHLIQLLFREQITLR